MKPKDKGGADARASLWSLLAIAVTICLGVPFLLVAGTGPSWWYNSAITTSGTAPLINGTANDYAVANQGQVKNIAVTAINELNSALSGIGGAGSTLNAMAVSLTATSGSTSDYAAVNLGQLKVLAKPFYDRLFSIDYSGPPLTSSTYPWLSGSGTANDYAVANIGQVKNLFSFDLTYSSDGNPLPNWWRMYYFGTLSVTATSTLPLNGGYITYLQAYNDQISPLPEPVFSPPGGLLASATSVVISATGATSIYYTTNGSDPAVSGSLYSTAIPVSSYETIQAIAYDGTTATEESAAIYSVAGNPVALSAGQYHSLAIKGDGTVWAWGANSYYGLTNGQLGTGSYVEQWYPAQVGLPFGAISVAAGWYHSLAVTTDGTAYAWGANYYGALGQPLGDPYKSNTPIAVAGLPPAIAVAAGDAYSLALTSGSEVWAWGENNAGQLGNGNYNSSSTPAQVTFSDTSGVKQIAAGGNFSVALLSDSTVWVWGDNGYGECGQGNFDNGTYTTPVEVTGTNTVNILAVAAGDDHILALRSDGTVWAWGSDDEGEAGNGTYYSTATPVRVLTSSTTTLTGVISVAAGSGCSIAVKADGTVWTWGCIGDGDLSGVPSSDYATQVTGISGGVIAAAGLHALVAGTDGSVTAIGVNTFGELGVGTTTSSTTTLLSQANLNAQPDLPTFSPEGGVYNCAQQVVITCSDSLATIYYTTDGSIPSPSNGVLIPSGQSVGINNPTMLRAVSVVGDVSSQTKSSTYHMGYQMLAGGSLSVVPMTNHGAQSILLNTDGTVWTWGGDGSGQLGLGWDTGSQVLPQIVTGLTGSATIISAGATNTAAITNSGTNCGILWVWGSDTYGQCGDPLNTGTGDPSGYGADDQPFQVPGVSGAIAVACGWYHTAAVTGSGTVLVWGLNSYGQLGNGAQSFTYTNTPTPVTGLTGVKAIAAGNSHTLALLDNGTVWAWGMNEDGELGNPSVVGGYSDVPVQVSGLSNIVAISAADETSFALRNDGTVWAWGNDTDDLLADDLGLNEFAPVLVGTMRDITAISVGLDHGVALRADGTVLAWGNNQNDAITSTASEPSLPVTTPNSALTDGTTTLPTITTMVSAGDYHTLKVLTTLGVQTLWAWGDNTYGELGDGTDNSRYTPAMVQFSGYANSGNDGMPNWQALTLGLDPFVAYSNTTGIPTSILVGDGLGLNPTLPYTPYTLPTSSGTSAPTIYITIPADATLY